MMETPPEMIDVEVEIGKKSDGQVEARLVATHQAGCAATRDEIGTATGATVRDALRELSNEARGVNL